MNKKPVSYKQYDPRWASKPYQVKGETANIKGSGCGPSCAAMLIETLTGRTYTPEQACAWSVAHGYKSKGHGTAYAYFAPQFEAFGLKCQMLNWSNTYGKPDHANHAKAKELVQQGYYLIACMGPGLWTKGGHFVVVWDWDGKVRINDPASSKTTRENGDPKTFCAQVKYYWWVDARAHNGALPPADKPQAAENNVNKEEDDMDKKETLQLINEALEAQREGSYYPTLADVPPCYQPSLRKLMDAGVLLGYDGGADKDLSTVVDNTIRVDENLCRCITVLDRLGILQ